MENWAEDYCVLEIVTTGHDPDTALPVEAAAIRVEKGEETSFFHTLIDSGVPVPACVREKSGRGEDDYRGGGEAHDALSRLCAFLGRSPVLAHEGKGMETAVLERFGAFPSGPILDTQELAWIVSPYLRDHSLAALASSLLGEGPTMRALDDARLLLRLLGAMRRAWGETPRRAREAIAGALEEAGSPWRHFLPGGRGRISFPDLTDLLPRVEEQRRNAGEGGPARASGSGEVGGTDPDEAARILAPGGALAALLPDHESRPQQTAMAEAVAAALNDDAFLVVEAGTGVGKSLAYLVPGVLHARVGDGPLVVSTYTRNLQEQLFHRDLPVLSRALGNFEFALLKGRSNYLCLRRWAEWCGALGRGDPVLHFGEHTPAESYCFLAAWLARTASGDLEEISLGLRFLLAELTSELASSSEDCMRSHCAFSSRCWVEKARARATESEVVVVNHALLLSQVCAAGEGPANLILPDYHALVLDEAHHLEDVATDAFSLSFSLEDCLRTMEDASGRGGLLPRWGVLALDTEGQGMLTEAWELTGKSRSQAEELCQGIIAPLLPGDAGKKGGEEARRRLDRVVLAHPVWEPARDTGLDLASGLSRLAALLPALAEKALALEGKGDEEALRAARKAEALSLRSQEAAVALEVFLREPDGEDFPRHLRWIERARSRQRSSAPPSIRLRSAPVSVAEELYSLLFAPLRSCVLTSASLRVPGGKDGFAFFLRRTGLGAAEDSGRDTRLLALDSPFDYSCQARLIAVSDMPEPRTGGEAFRRYMRGVSGVVEDTVLATGGKALVLLTSHQQVEFLYSELRPRLEERGLCCLRQRRGMPNALLLERFRADRDSVLLATEAFWEGVDVPGESLSAVIMVKLPFRHPQDPVVAGRVEHHDRDGSGGWGSYYMPLALTLFRQGVGRLVRRSTDRGIIVVLDPRFLTRSYARLFHAALPHGLRVETVRGEDLAETIRACF
ncbi:MAG: helicase C-terminal domain-containing protein [Actinomycetota bacterium]|nr:helicase C-terminal domain-containing protein [Actinomycetota bacterium]